jgi:REP element-mobilizing transposase RayT
MAKQLEFKKVKGWGGKRTNAGRKNRTGKVSHGKRKAIDLKKPMHITMKFDRVYLRNRATLKAFKNAVKEAKGFCLYVVHYSIQNDHIHMIVEAKDNESMARGMKSLCGRFGKIIRSVIGGSGPVFKGRFHQEVITSPTQMKRALAYVLLNTAKHMKVFDHIDAFSSGWAFKEWRKLLGGGYTDIIHDELKQFARDLEELSPARSWLASKGWMRAH